MGSKNVIVQLERCDLIARLEIEILRI